MGSEVILTKGRDPVMENSTHSSMLLIYSCVLDLLLSCRCMTVCRTAVNPFTYDTQQNGITNSTRHCQTGVRRCLVKLKRYFYGNI